MATNYPYRKNPPIKPWEKLCGLCQRRWPYADMVKQRGVLICQRPTCLDEPNPRDVEK